MTKVLKLISFYCDDSDREIKEVFKRHEINKEKFGFIFGLAEFQVVIEIYE
jgi:hypothetical protein